MERPNHHGPHDEVQRVADIPRQIGEEGTIDSLERVGDLFLTSESYALALAQFTSILEHPDWPAIEPARRAGIELKTGRARAGLGDLDGALSSGSRALSETRAASSVDPLAAGHAHAFLAQIHRKRGEHTDALEHGLLALEKLKNTNEQSEVAFLQLNVGAVYLREGRLRDAEHFFQDGLATYRRTEDQAGAAKALNSLGVVYNNLGQWQSAISCLRRAAEIDESLGNYSQTARRCLNLGIVYSHTGDWGSARSLFDRSLKMSRNIGDAIGVARASLGLARIERWCRSFYRAEQLVREAIASTREGGARRESAAAVEEAGALAAARGDFDGAMLRFREALDISRSISSGPTDHDADVQRRVAEILIHRNQLDDAFDTARRAYGAAARTEDRRLAGAALRVLGIVFHTRGEKNRARSAFTRAIHHAERLGAPLELARTLREAGRVREGLWCSASDARNHLIRAEALFRGLGLAQEAGGVLIERARVEMSLHNNLEALSLLREAERANAQVADDVALREIDALRRQLETETAQNTASLDLEFLNLRRSAHATGADLSSVLALVVESARADRAFVAASDGMRLSVRALHGVALPTARGLCRSIAERHRERLENGEAVISYGEFSGGEADVLSYIIVPIMEAGRRAGLLYVDRSASDDRLPFGRLELHFVVAAGSILRGLLVSDDAALASTEAPAESPFAAVVTRSRRMLDILEMLKKVAGASSTILLQGETGTGKGLLAYEISRWSDGPFVTINCADLSETILESELFGHARNAFTGAGTEKRGLFEIANGGTVFIDEIDKTSRNFQERLLRVVDRREIKPVGSTTVKKVDCRIIVAANRELRGQVEKGEFLKDLYYRLRVIAIALPALRERREDIPMLVEHFLNTFQTKMKKSGIRFSDEAMECIESHDWPGNIRDLENEVERAVALNSSDALVDARDLSDETVGNPVSETLVSGGRGKRLADVVEEIETRLVREALRTHKGNKCRAAAALGLTRRGLKNKIARYGLE
ncbi:MAG: sigma 54-interacting transcriptional regulator [bacterium]